MGNNFARLGTYLLFLVRRERYMSAIWIVCLAGLVVLFASLYPPLLPTQTEMMQLAVTMDTPAMIAMMGKVYGMEQLSQASMMAQECLVWYLISIAIMNIFLVNRHTRVDEELGRLEMFRAMPVGRLTGSMATILFAFAVNLLIALFSAAGLIVLDIGGTTVEGALVLGFAIGAVGFVFAGLTLLAAQVFSTARGVSGFCFALIGVFYIMRALGDISGSALSLVSPIGLGLAIEAFYRNDVLPVVVLFAEGLIFSAVALVVCTIRDHGMGVIAARKGREHASRFLRSPLGLAWNLSRGTSIGWAVGMFLLAASYGSVCGDINRFVEGNDLLSQMLGADGSSIIIDNYIALIFAIMSLVVSIPVVLTVLRIHGEEKRGRLEQIFSKSVPRQRLYGCFILVALVESLVFELSLSTGLVAASGGELEMTPIILCGLSYLPAIWAVAGLAVLLVGYLPRLSALVWAIFAYTFIVLYFGKIMNVPEWAVRITPFGNIPNVPVEDFALMPLVVLTLVAVALALPGLKRFNERDIG